MRLYLMSLGAGVLVGVFYSLLNMRSPAPPVIALVGLLGILLGEQLLPVSKKLMVGLPLGVACRDAGCIPHLFGSLPGRLSEEPTVPSETAETKS
jgi:XapX domain-containing protein